MLQEIISRICALQLSHSADKTPEMAERGELLRNDLVRHLEKHLREIESSTGKEFDDVYIKPSDGAGAKAEVPWVRFASKLRSPGASKGWYCVYLFRADGKGVYLALGFASKIAKDGQLKARDAHELEDLRAWGHKIISTKLKAEKGHITSIDLQARTSLGQSYENAIIAAKYYELSSFPSEREFYQDAYDFAEMLGDIYRASDLGLSPEDEDAIVTTIKELGTKSSKRQGYGLTAVEKDAVESHAMQLAKNYLLDNGYKCSDVSRKKGQSCDYLAKKSDIEHIVEVKGTTSKLGSVIVTYNEVERHKESFPNNMMIVVYEIDLDRTSTPPRASGGQIKVYHPWDVTEYVLKPLSYECALN
ncbi:MrcB family domain-containing protein [Vibrio cidicii]|uniref:MrcB family domain-containing protein n=1 Tax=Vibrio cidicii TaxID=1763883 RepID=UPI003703EAAE